MLVTVNQSTNVFTLDNSKDHPSAFFAGFRADIPLPKALDYHGFKRFGRNSPWTFGCYLDVSRGSDSPNGVYQISYDGSKWPVFDSINPKPWDRMGALYLLLLTEKQWQLFAHAENQPTLYGDRR